MFKKKKHVVVVGNGMTSIRFCEKLLEYDACHEYRITVIGDEPLPAYDRVALSSCFTGTSERELIFAEARWYAYSKIKLQLGVRVNSIDRSAQTVTTANGKTIDYDILVLATGARPHIPNIENTHLDGVHVYRTLADVDAIRETGASAKNAVVIGGGLLGLEAAEACKELGVDAVIVERQPHLMACQLDAAGGTLLRDKVEALDIKVRTGEHVVKLEGDQAVEAVHLENDCIPADLVVLATGIQPNDELGRDAGLSIGAKGGIAVDKTVRTSDANIYAIGECASFNDITFGLVAPGYAMAEAAAAHLGGINKTFHASVPASQLKLLDLQVASIGETHLAPPHARHIIEQDAEQGIYKKLITDPEGKHLLGTILMGETSEFGRLQKLIEEETELPEHPEELLAPIGEPLQPELDMEDDDVVCFCSYVTKKDICTAIDEKQLKTTGDVMGTTYAAGLCGSCYDTVDKVTKFHLAEKGSGSGYKRL
jgi:nitrite reductase (NADH) large subunit